MVTQHPGQGHAGGRSAGRAARKVLTRTALGGGLALLFLFLAVFWVLPELGRRGDLNALVERLIRSVLAVPVEIGSVETDPLSEFSITRVESVSAEMANRFRFQADRLSIFYLPLELVLGRHARELAMQGPYLFLDLDRDLTGLVLPAPEAQGGGRFRLDRFRIAQGRLEARVGGRSLKLDGLDLDVGGLGQGGDLAFRVEARFEGARLAARGDLIRLAGPSAPPRYRLEGVRLDVEDVDLAPLIAPLGPAAPVVEGRASLTGSAEGVWPERVAVRLGSKLRGGRASLGAATGLSGGEAALEATLVVEGELERVAFDVSFEAAGRLQEAAVGADGPADYPERLALRAKGAYARRAGGGGPVRGGGAQPRGIIALERASLEAPGLGRLEASGSIDLSHEDPALDLEFRLPRLTLKELAAHGVGRPLRELASLVQGSVALGGRVGGSLHDPWLSLELSLEDALLALPGRKPAPFLLSGRIGRARYQGQRLFLAGVEFELGRLALADLPGLLGKQAEGLELSGVLEATARAQELTLPPGPVVGRLSARITGGSVRAPQLEAPSFEAGGELRLQGDLGGRVKARLEAELHAPEFALGPVVESPGKEPLALRGDLELEPLARAPRVSFDLTAVTPSAGPLHLEGTMRWSEAGEETLDLELRAPSIPNDRFLAVYLRDPFQLRYPILEGARFSGTSSVEARLAAGPGRLALEGVVHARGTGASLSGLDVADLTLDLPFRLGEGLEPGRRARGFLAAGRVRFRSGQREVGLESLLVPFTLEEGAYRIGPAPVSLPFLDGRVELGRLELRPEAGRGERLRLSLEARDLDLEGASALLGLHPVRGKLHLDLKDLVFSGDRLDVNGRLILDLFGGRAEVTGLSILHPGTAYSLYSLSEVKLTDLRLDRLGEELGFGVASGVLEGRVWDLAFTLSEIVRFNADFETVKRRGVSQYINKAAIESIHKVIAGPFGVLEEMFFQKFRFAGFGFTASLREGRLRLEGKYQRGDVEHIMYSRWWQFPRVNIVNTLPGIDYDWDQIVDNLKAVIRRRNVLGRPQAAETGDSR